MLIELLDGEPDPEDLVAFCSRRFAPTRLTNTEGDSIVRCELVLSVGAPDAVGAGLDQLYQGLDSGAQEWIHERTIDGTDRILASLRLEGAELRISTNSERRPDDALAAVRQLDPGVIVVSDERQPLPDARAIAKLAGQRPRDAAASGRPEDQSPEVQKALAAYLRDYEQKWLDLEIPALQGLRPRQAAEDPTRREDLARLLASFGDARDSPLAMSPKRLRTALGLTSAS